MFEIIKEKERWDGIIAACEAVDFYHSYSYHQLAKKPGEAPVLICYSEGDKIIAIPLLFRKIENTDYLDATSVYGYPGPITKNITENFDFSIFKRKLQDFLKAQNLISIFSRLNPFIPLQENCLSGIGEIETLGRIIYFNLTKIADNYRPGYSKRLRTYINKSRTIYTIKKANTMIEVDQFTKLYHENMVRVNANNAYFFDHMYFSKLLKSNDFDAELLLAIHNQTHEVAGGAIFVKKNDIVQYHLSGASEKYLALNPIKLLIDEMRIKATHENYSYFNLGGGVGNREDSLFHFKLGFSKDTRPFRLWKYIVDNTIYEKLVRQLEGNENYIKHNKFFPFYRSEI